MEGLVKSIALWDAGTHAVFSVVLLTIANVVSCTEYIL